MIDVRVATTSASPTRIWRPPTTTHEYEFAPRPPAAIALGVPDVAEAKAQLEAGVPVGEMWDSGVCRGAGVGDPAGNRILLHHCCARHPDGTKL